MAGSAWGIGAVTAVPAAASTTAVVSNFELLLLLGDLCLALAMRLKDMRYDWSFYICVSALSPSELICYWMSKLSLGELAGGVIGTSSTMPLLGA